MKTTLMFVLGLVAVGLLLVRRWSVTAAPVARQRIPDDVTWTEWQGYVN